ncbi:uncharacterized protein LOC127254420 [Andrographis paniculata]|uniref:uncharacterized protein LOC127254420 n=1 Tax=Andrographis paniculata TaxID=175694 RepID=UPI0021E75C08|nr:uncharacterized protein LOC127254420 [Andrographis paniculata]
MSPSETTPLAVAKPHRQFRWTLRRGRRRLPSVRLGGKKPGRGFFLLRVCRRVKLRWLRQKYMRLLRKLKESYSSFMADVIEGSRTVDSYQQRMLLESSFAIPVMGLSFASYPTSSYGRDRPVF